MCQTPPEKRLWCIRLPLKSDVQHKITSNRLRPYGIDYFSISLTTNSSMSRSTWKGQAAGNSKTYWPSCTACKARCNHDFSANFGKKVVETRILWHFYGLIYRPVQGHSLLNLLPKTKLSSKEQQKRLWCIQLALKPDVQHKITSNRLRPYGIDYFSIGLTTNSSMSRSTSGVDTKMWALLRSQGANSDSVSIKWFGTGTSCHVQAFSNNVILASYMI